MAEKKPTHNEGRKVPAAELALWPEANAAANIEAWKHRRSSAQSARLAAKCRTFHRREFALGLGGRGQNAL